MLAGPRHYAATLALLSAFVFGACRGGDDSALDQDSALARDLARAGVDTTVQPQLEDVPAPPPAAAPQRTRTTTQPSRPKATPPQPKTEPQPAPPTPVPAEVTTVTKSEAGSEPALGTIAAGTNISLASADSVCTNTNRVGDRFTATVTSAVSGSNGAVIPVGSRVTVEVTQLHRSENTNDKIVMGFRVVSVSIGDKTYTPEAEIVSAEITRVRASTTKDDAKKVIGGAVAGAIIGQVLGRDRKGTLIGAAAGAAAGVGAAAATADYDGCVRPNAPIIVTLRGPLTIAAG